MLSFIAGLTLACYLFTLETCSAQVSSGKGEWKYLVEPYIMFPTLSGETTIRNLPAANLAADANDIFSKLQMGFMLFGEARNDRFAINTDFLYADLKQDVSPGSEIISGNSTAKQIVWEVSGLYRILQYLEIGAGARLNNISSGLNLILDAGDSEASASADISNTWLDPVLIVRSAGVIKEHYLLQFRGDIGGFGLGSELTWQLQGSAGYKFKKHSQLSIGYKMYKLDYDRGEDADRFMYNVNMFGPVIKYGYNF